MSLWRGLGYIAVLILLVLVHWIIRRNYHALLRGYINGMDSVIADYTSTLYAHRNQIYEYADNVSVLFSGIRSLVKDDSVSYQGYASRLLADMEYAQSLLPEVSFGVDVVMIDQQTQTLGQMKRLYDAIGIIIVIITAGLYLLRRPHLLST